MKNCRDRLIISSGFQEKGGCPLIRACSVITSNTVYAKVCKMVSYCNFHRRQHGKLVYVSWSEGQYIYSESRTTDYVVCLVYPISQFSLHVQAQPLKVAVMKHSIYN